MKKERNIPDLNQEKLRSLPFTVPEGYFENLPGRIRDRLEEEAQPEPRVRKLTYSNRLRLAIAAAIIGLALISYPVIKSVSNGGDLGYYPDMALLEQMDLFDEDVYLMEWIGTGTEIMDDDEAFVNQAIEYLAMADVEIDLIFE